MIRFTKMHGIGNDFIMIDTLRDGTPPGSLSNLSKHLNDRRFGVGGDGLILIEKGDQAPFRMRMLNPDGSESEMCGNGVRCFAKLLKDHAHLTGNEVDVETGAGILTLTLTGDSLVRVDMGPARLTRGEIGMVGEPSEKFIDQSLSEWNGTAVSMGNPHVVLFVDDVESVDLETLGPRLERHEFFPKRVNVHIVQVLDRTHLRMRTWERGAGITLACGTGACAVAVSSFLNGHSERNVDIRLPGGHLQIEYREDGKVMMTGPAETVFEGQTAAALETVGA
jgi:diaminopimelate epimerase